MLLKAPYQEVVLKNLKYVILMLKLLSPGRIEGFWTPLILASKDEVKVWTLYMFQDFDISGNPPYENQNHPMIDDFLIFLNKYDYNS